MTRASGVAAWAPTLVYMIGEWSLEEKRAQATQEDVPVTVVLGKSKPKSLARLGEDLMVAMKRRYKDCIAEAMVCMLEAFDVIHNIFSIIKEKTPNQAAKDDVSCRHGLAGVLKK